MWLKASVLLLSLGCASVLAQSPGASVLAPPVPGDVAEMAAVVVSGVQPGPGLWKVSKGDHVMWVLGTLSPLPRNVQWQSHDLEEVIGGSQQVLLSPAIKLRAKVGFVGKLFLMPSALSARKNEGGETLQQVLPPPLYARWQASSQKYLDNERKVERWRPLFAAQKVYSGALKAHGLSNSGGIKNSIDALAKKHGVTEVPVEYVVTIEKPREAIKAFKASAPNDLTCLSRTLDSIEQDMPAMAARANAWATGDLELLRQLPDSDRREACVSALTGAGFARTLGLDDVVTQLKTTWLTAARTALQTNTQTFAMLPMDELISSNGYLATLKAEGYAVQAPDEDDTDADTDAEPPLSAPVDEPAAAETHGNG